MEDLAQRIDVMADWDDLVLPARPLQMLREIGAQARQDGIGVTALFIGASGTGKTLSAEVLAHELRRDLYRIDLRAVVSKYVGETEKNLRRVFDAADASGAVLFFDEADALFVRRSEVKGSHDRYANIEVNYLLQRMEACRGLVILATNMTSAIDPAFVRRFQSIVEFPMPDAAERADIWRRVFPPGATVCEIDVDKLARLDIAGGTIRRIALTAARLAADAGDSVRMSYLLSAARREYAKIGKPLVDSEINDWS